MKQHKDYIICCLLVIVFCSAYLHAQNIKHIYFKNYTANEGLSQNGVKCFAQDSVGFMWIGTNDGLNRFDGFEFKHYFHNSKDSTSIPGNVIFDLFVDSLKNIWVATDQGLAVYNPLNDIFEQIKLPGTRNPKIVTICREDEKTLWVGARKIGVFSIRNYLTSNTVIEYFDSRRDYRINSIFHSKNYKDKQLWVGTEDGLYLLDKKTGKMTSFYKGKPISLLTHPFHVKEIKEDRLGNLMVAGANALPNQPTFYIYDSVKDILVPPKNWIPGIQDFGMAVIDFQFDKQNNIFLSLSGNGLYYLELNKDGTYEHFPVGYESLIHPALRTVFIDRQNIIWLGSFNGISKATSDIQRFKYLQHNMGEQNKNLSNSVRAILKDSRGRLWHGGYAGLFLKTKTGWQNFSDRFSNSKGMEGNHVRIIYEDPKYNGRVFWIGMEDQGLNRFDVQNRTFKNYSYNALIQKTLNSNLVTAILRDSDNDLLIGTNDAGLHKMDEQMGSFEQVPNPDINANGFNSNVITFLFEDSKNNLWVGTGDDGLKLFDRQNNKVVHFRKEDGLPNNDVISIVESQHGPKKGMLWIGTKGGLSYLTKDPLGKIRFKNYSRTDGLPDDVIYGILEDSSGTLWLSTNKGIAHFNFVKKKIRLFDYMDGLQDNEFNTGAYFKADDGEMFFGGINGITHFYPQDIKDNQHVPEIAVTGLKKFNINVQTDTNIVYRKSIELNYNENMISFNVSALDYAVPEKNEYAYKLENFNKDWIYNGNKREIIFTNLDPGNYTLRVKGSNNDGIWNEEGTSIKVIVYPPFWATWWFRLIIVLSILLLIYIIFIIRVKTIRESNVALTKEIKERKLIEKKLRRLTLYLQEIGEKDRTSIAREMHDELGQILTALKMDVIILEKSIVSQKDNLKADIILTDTKNLKKLIDETINNVRKLIQELRPEVLDNLGLIDALQWLATEFESRSEMKISCKSTIGDIKLEKDYNVAIFRIVQESLTNVIRHSQATKVNLDIKQENHSLIVNISDNGIGFSTDQQKLNKFGLLGIEERALVFNGNVQIESAHGKGTSIIVNVPLPN